MSTRTVESRWPALLVLCAGSLMIILDGSIVAVALPAIQRDLGFTATGLAWVVNAYLVAFGGLLLLAGRLGDLLGRRAVFLAGVALFTVASLFCAVATGPEALVVARFLQGVGGALTMAVSLGMIVGLFPSRPSGRALSRCSASPEPPGRRSACWPGACSPTWPAGPPSSRSTCRSGC
ncbi:MFS transporter [Micromonospora sp. NPDC023814]|uniref:MFS transporter n=1 Tax=Micromonospora sp. NPDC023814 TaxID=3154596 RepID=UPI0033E99026